MKHLFAFALPDTGLKPLTLPQIRRSKTGNDYLLSDRKDISCDGPALAIELEQVKAAAAAQGATLKHEGDGALLWVWRSPAIGFPNGLYAFVDGGRVHLYGRALYGRRDFGANRQFIQGLLADLLPG